MNSKRKIAAVLAFVVGIFSIFAGGMAMRGWEPGYSMLGWLPIYNFSMGILTVFIPTVLIWKNNRHASTGAFLFFGIHTGATALLLLVFRDSVATQSLLAMTFRLVVWLVILALIYFSKPKTK
ncbi:MAG: hypothetical protein IH589_10285 [Anaerolineales bacterium]|nr:hypothetical protein [Anaerolineales bacterium]